MGAITAEFNTPWYYRQFQCKGGACRHTCCAGLAVNVSQEEYFQLLSVPCSASLRSDLDVALKPLKDADPYRYAGLMPTFFGGCRLLDEEGLCRLQKECGLEALPAGCRYFPRSPHFSGQRQSCMANACEETLELLYYSDKPWSEVSENLTFHLAGEMREDYSPEAQAQLSIHRKAVTLIAEEDRPLNERLELLGELVNAQGDRDEEWLVVSQKRAGILQQLLEDVGESYDSLRPYCEAAELRSLNQAEAVPDYDRALLPIRAHFPRFDHFLTLALANDLYYRFFPFTGAGISQQESILVLHCEIELLLYLCAMNLNEVSTEAELIDLFSAFFRMAELTAFDRNCLTVVRRAAAE